ncbi:MAG: F0F1 ATP synthase subunit delta [Candidatus Paceibacterota bacterium]
MEEAQLLFTAIKNAKNEAEEKAVIDAFIAVLQRTHAVSRGPGIIAALEKMLDKDAGILRPIITTATALTEEQATVLAEKIQLEHKATAVHLDQRIDTSVLGGMSIRIDDMLYDATLKKKLLTLTNTLKQ